MRLSTLSRTACRADISDTRAEVPGDTELQHFTIEEDLDDIIPLIKDAMAVSGSGQYDSIVSLETIEHRDDDRGALRVQTTLELLIYLFAHGCRDSRERSTSRAVR